MSWILSNERNPLGRNAPPTPRQVYENSRTEAGRRAALIIESGVQAQKDADAYQNARMRYAGLSLKERRTALRGILERRIGVSDIMLLPAYVGRLDDWLGKTLTGPDIQALVADDPSLGSAATRVPLYIAQATIPITTADMTWETANLLLRQRTSGTTKFLVRVFGRRVYQLIRWALIRPAIGVLRQLVGKSAVRVGGMLVKRGSSIAAAALAGSAAGPVGTAVGTAVGVVVNGVFVIGDLLFLYDSTKELVNARKQIINDLVDAMIPEQ